MARNTADDKVRVNQMQRESAVSTLRDAAADGRLAFDELNERVAAALTAITRGDLVRLIDDLVVEDRLDGVLADAPIFGDGPGLNPRPPSSTSRSPRTAGAAASP